MSMLNEIKEQVLKSNLELFSSNLAILTWGNVSSVCRQYNCFVIKPSGVAYSQLSLDNLAVVSLDNMDVIDGSLKPSSDTATHFYLYNFFKNIGAVVHTHSPYAVAWAQAGREIPVFGTTHADFSSAKIPCTRRLLREEVENDYELNTGKVIAEHFQKYGYNPSFNPAVLVACHGPFIFGKDASDAVNNAITLEAVSKMAFMTEALSGNNAAEVDDFLSKKHFLRKHGKNAYYGQTRK